LFGGGGGAVDRGGIGLGGLLEVDCQDCRILSDC